MAVAAAQMIAPALELLADPTMPSEAEVHAIVSLMLQLLADVSTP